MTALVTFDDHSLLLRGRLITPCMPSWPVKDPGDVRLLGADFGPIVCGETVIRCSAVAQGCTIVGAASFAGSVVSLLVSGGVDQTVATVSITVTWGAQSVTRAVLLPIAAQAPGLVA